MMYFSIGNLLIFESRQADQIFCFPKGITGHERRSNGGGDMARKTLLPGAGEGAVKALREKYNLPITYEGPMYTCPCDLVDMTRMREKTGPKIIVPRARSFHFEYTEINGKPQEEITALLQRLVTEFASQGGRFLMCGNELSRRETMERDREAGPQQLGSFGRSARHLGTPIFISKARRNEGEFLAEITQQLSTVTGSQVRFGGSNSNTLMGVAELGADNISVRDALTLNYDPEHGGRYLLNLSWTVPPSLPSL